MFNIGAQELLVILAIALIVVGPAKLPELARSIGKGLRELRKVQDDVKDMVRFDLDTEPDRPATRAPTPPSKPRIGSGLGPTSGGGRAPEPAAGEPEPVHGTPEPTDEPVGGTPEPTTAAPDDDAPAPDPSPNGGSTGRDAAAERPTGSP